jgi:hypothetical protein
VERSGDAIAGEVAHEAIAVLRAKDPIVPRVPAIVWPAPTCRRPVHGARQPFRQSRSTARVTGGTSNEVLVAYKTETRSESRDTSVWPCDTAFGAHA